MARSRYRRAVHSAPARPPFLASLTYYSTYLIIYTIIGVSLWFNWPWIMATFQARTAGAPAATSPAPATAPRPQLQPYLPSDARIPAQALPTISLPQIEATSQAIYQATVQAVDASMPQPNTDTTGDTAPLERQSKENTLAPAGPDVATAEPLPQTTDQFGSKVAPIDIQGTHTCLHGQIWTATGCHRPTPVQP